MGDRQEKSADVMGGNVLCRKHMKSMLPVIYFGGGIILAAEQIMCVRYV